VKPPTAHVGKRKQVARGEEGLQPMRGRRELEQRHGGWGYRAVAHACHIRVRARQAAAIKQLSQQQDGNRTRLAVRSHIGAWDVRGTAASWGRPGAQEIWQVADRVGRRLAHLMPVAAVAVRRTRPT